MSKYYVLGIDSLIQTFTVIDSGKKVRFSYIAQEEMQCLANVKTGDMILGYYHKPIGQLKILFEVVSSGTSGKVELVKKLEIDPGITIGPVVEAEVKNKQLVAINKERFDKLYEGMLSRAKVDVLTNYGYLYELENKDFAQEIFGILKVHELLTKENMQVFTDKRLTSEILKNSFPVLKKINLGEEKSKQLKDKNGRSRYYPEELTIEDNKYVITNNWYHGGQNDRDTRTPFVEWMVKQINGEEVIEKDKVIALKDICVTASEIGIPRNYLVFGAPGTGKSHEIKELQEKHFKEEGAYERVTFHSNYSYANFVGTYKPKMNGKDIEYAFVPGPFIRILEKAYKNPEKNFLLIIEEINRANPAAVFGDVFQLLDRKMGKSEYPVMTSEELKLYFAQKFVPNFNEIADEKKKQNILALYSEIYIPSNMYIWATMNSADQGVFPMDTAFKRRWDFKYITINENSKKMEKVCVKVPTAEGTFAKINWNVLREEINERLSSVQCKVNEDKLLGPYFISGDILKVNQEDNCVVDNNRFLEVFKNKVLMYLYEDAVKQRKTELFMGCGNVSRFSGICEAFDEKGIEIFGRDLAAKVIKITQEGSV